MPCASEEGEAAGSRVGGKAEFPGRSLGASPPAGARHRAEPQGVWGAGSGLDPSPL